MEISYRNFIRTLLAALQFNEQTLVDVHLVQKAFYKYAELPEYEDLFASVSKTTDKHLQEYADSFSEVTTEKKFIHLVLRLV